MQFLSRAVFLFSMNNKLSISVLSAIMAAFSFSLAAAMVPYFYTAGGSVFLLLCVRYIFTLALSSVLDRAPRKQKTKKINARLVLISILQALFIASYMYSIKLIPLSLAVVVIYTFPIITFFANSLIKSRTVDALSVVALLVSLFGILVMVQGGSTGWNLWGVFWGLIASVAQVSVNILSRHESIEPGWGLVKYITILPSIVFLLIYFTNTAEPIASVTPEIIMWGVLSAIGMSGGFYFFFNSIARIGPVRTANVMYMEPVFTIILGVVLLGNILGYYQWLGILIILLATVTLERWGRKYS